jgi:hypothetical protein
MEKSRAFTMEFWLTLREKAHNGKVALEKLKEHLSEDEYNNIKDRF